MKKGFTLVEVLSVVIIIGVISLIITPITIGVIDRAKTNMYNRQIDSFKEATRTYITENPLAISETKIIYLSTLTMEGFLDTPIKNQKTGDNFDEDCVEITIFKNPNYTYDISIDENICD